MSPFHQTALMSLKEWLAPSVPLLMCRFCGTTPNSTALGPLLKSICQQICYCDMLPFEVRKEKAHRTLSLICVSMTVIAFNSDYNIRLFLRTFLTTQSP